MTTLVGATGLPGRGPWRLARHETCSAEREWIVTNGLGGYASGPIHGGLTRRYHGLLVAALPAPVGRLVCVGALRVHLKLEGETVLLDRDSPPEPGARHAQVSFSLAGGLPVWRYELDGVVLEKRVVMPHGLNTTCVLFHLPDAPADARLECRLLLDLRHPDEPAPDLEARTAVSGDRLHVGGIDQTPAVRISAHGGQVAYDLVPHDDFLIEMIEERDRGYPHLARAGTAGPILLAPDEDGIAALTLTIEPESDDPERSPVERWRAELDRRTGLLRRAGPPGDPLAAQLVLAADQFIVAPVAHEGTTDEPAGRTVIAGYHWFTDWGRDTMIGLEGLTLATGRAGEAREILRLFARHVRDGLIPNLFPEGRREALYHTADATLWYFHALDRYVARTGDRTLLAELLPLLGDVLAHHRAGTRFGIGVDPSDGLLRQGEAGYQLTWMDAKVDDWVVTPRRGKAVEINALWHNALSLMAGWLRDTDPGEAARVREEAGRIRAAFNRRFWNARSGFLFDVVDGESGDDPACRPNQIFAVSLPHPVLDASRWRAVVDAVGQRLLTPLGLRTLDPGHADYRPKYFGDLRTRDAAYHQGTAWPWLLGAYVDALLKIDPDPDAARRVLAAFDAHLDEAGVGSISEIVDASAPHVPRGCIAQAWSVAEILRAWMKTTSGRTHEQRNDSLDFDHGAVG